MAHEPTKLKIGKGSPFVKRDLRRLPRADDVWEAGFFPPLANGA